MDIDKDITLNEGLVLRDANYRMTALTAAVGRAGQDGGLEGDAVDVLTIANVYYQWLTGDEDLHDPYYEIAKAKK